MSRKVDSQANKGTRMQEVWRVLGDSDDIREVGGKASALGSLMQAGINVPPGFVVLTNAYLSHLQRTCEKNPPPDDMQAALLKTEMDRSVHTAIEQAWQRMGWAEGSVHLAVRSSATVEDGTKHSFAGQFETYLNISTIDDCLQSIIKCWASVWTPHVQEYIKQQPGGAKHLGMAVIVQIMPEIIAAGVAFSAEPVSGNRDIAFVEGVSGVADDLVGGSVSSEFAFWIGPDQKILRSDVHSEVLPVNQNIIKDIAKSVRAIETIFNSPQDIEWVVTPQLDLYIVQARPITKIPDYFPADIPQAWELAGRPPGGWTSDQRAVFDQWDIYNARVIYPLDWDLFENAAWEANLRMFDFIKDVPHVEKVAIEVDGVVVGVDPSAQQDCQNSYFRVDQFPIVDNWEPIFSEWEQKLTLLRSKFEPARLNDSKLLELLDASAEMFRDAFCLRMASMARWINPEGTRDPDESAEDAIKAMLAAKGVKDIDDTLTDLCSGIDHETAKMTTSLWELESEISANRDAISDPEFATKVNSFILKYGHFQHNNVPMGLDPQSIWSLLATAATRSEPRPNLYTQGLKKFEKRQSELKRLFAPKEFDELMQNVHQLRLWTERRESSKSKQNMAFPLLRQICDEVGKRFDEREQIQPRKATKYLRRFEIDHYLHGKAADLNKKILRRRHICEWKEDRSWLPDGFLEADFDKNSTYIQGIGVSSGRIAGKIRVIKGPVQFSEVQSGDIVVTVTTSPIWSQILSRVGGIIVEHGARLSHISIAAREYEIPAIIGVKGATKIFDNGESVSIDGTTGGITREEKLSNKQLPTSE